MVLDFHLMENESIFACTGKKDVLINFGFPAVILPNWIIYVKIDSISIQIRNISTLVPKLKVHKTNSLTLEELGWP